VLARLLQYHSGMKTTTSSKKKLSLSRDTLRALSAVALDQVWGGTSNITQSCNGGSCAGSCKTCAYGCV
jgi:hypothetical protein